MSVFFDLEKAYNATWKYGILSDLNDAGLCGRMPELIGKFLNDRSFHVRVGLCLSDAFKQEMGVPQGSILSVTLFILKINGIIKCLPAGVRGSLYVDDFVICFRSKSVIAIRMSTPGLYKQHTKIGGRKRISVFEYKKRCVSATKTQYMKNLIFNFMVLLYLLCVVTETKFL